MCLTWLVHMCDVTHSYVWHDAFICVTWLIHMCDMTPSYVWHDSLICATWLIHMCDITHSYVWHDSFMCVTRPIHMCDMTHSYVWHDVWHVRQMHGGVVSFIWMSHVPHMIESCYTYECVTSHIWMSHISGTYERVTSHAHLNESRRTSLSIEPYASSKRDLYNIKRAQHAIKIDLSNNKRDLQLTFCLNRALYNAIFV